MNILFIVGPALGHIVRSLVIGKQLSHDGFNIQYVSADVYGYANLLISPLFMLHKFNGNVNVGHGVPFADYVINLVDDIKPDIVCYDLSPSPWLIQMPYTNLPEVFITNVFLTRLGTGITSQDLRFQEIKDVWNDLRLSRNLPELKSYRELYERKLVLLADPAFITDLYLLPDNYHCIGPCTWQPEEKNNDKYYGKKDILYISTGSTGIKKIPELLVNKVKQELKCSTIIETVQSYNKKSPEILLPGSTILKNSRFAITQGGTGSSYQALENGVPVGCWPTSYNHRILGSILEQLKLGVLFEEHNWEEKLDYLKVHISDMSDNVKSYCKNNDNNYSIKNVSSLFRNI